MFHVLRRNGKIKQNVFACSVHFRVCICSHIYVHARKNCFPNSSVVLCNILQFKLMKHLSFELRSKLTLTSTVCKWGTITWQKET